MSRRNKIISYCFRDLDHYCGVKKIPVPRKSMIPEKKEKIVFKSVPYSLLRALNNQDSIENVMKEHRESKVRKEEEEQSEKRRKIEAQKPKRNHHSKGSRVSQVSSELSNYPHPSRFNQNGSIKLNLMTQDSDENEDKAKSNEEQSEDDLVYDDDEDDYGIKRHLQGKAEAGGRKTREQPKPWHLSPGEDEELDEEEKEEDSNFFSFNRGEKEAQEEEIDLTMDKTMDRTKVPVDKMESTVKLRQKEEKIGQLNRQLSEFEKIVDKLEEEKKALDKELAFSKSLVEQKARRVDNLDQENQDLANINSKFKREFSDLQDDHKNASLKFVLLGIEMLRLNKDLEDKEHKLILEQRQQETLAEENKELAEKLDMSRSEMKKSFHRQDTEVNELKEQIALKKEQLERRDQLLEDAKEEIDSYKTEVNQLKNKLEETKIDCGKSMIEKLREFEIEITELKDENDFLKETIERNKEERSKMPKQVKILKTENHSLKKQLVEISKERDEAFERLMKEHAKLTDLLGKERYKSKELGKENDEVKDVLQAVNDEKKELEKTVFIQKKEILKMRKDLARQKKDLSDREEYKKRLEDVLYELETFKQEQQEIENENNERMIAAEKFMQERDLILDKMEDYKEEIERLREENEDLTQDILTLNQGDRARKHKSSPFTIQQGSRDLSSNSVKHFLMALEIHRLNKIVENISSDNRKLMELLNIENNRGLANSSWSSNTNTYKESTKEHSPNAYSNSYNQGYSSRIPGGTQNNSKYLNVSTERELNDLKQSKFELESKVHDYMKTIRDLENKVKLMSDKYRDGSSSRISRKKSPGSDEGRIRDLEMKLKILRIENGKLDEALIGKIKEMESMKQRVSGSIRESEFGDISRRSAYQYGGL